MSDKIAIGFHACVDYEIVFNLDKLIELIEKYNIQDEELNTDLYIENERQLLAAALGHMKNGMGCEFVPETPEICEDFANHFEYKVTIGGTAARAAIGIDKIGYESALSITCFNHYIRDLLPERAHYYSNVGNDHNIVFPHVVFSYPGNIHIKAAGVDFVTPRENRMMFSRDIDSLNMVISQGFASRIKDAEVMLVSCFSEVLDKNILEERVATLKELLKALPSNAFVIHEDGCYINKEFRHYVHKQLAPQFHALSMNEDEMQEYIEKRIDIMDADAVLEAVEYIYKNINIPTIIVHSAKWAIAYGKNAKAMEHVLLGGINLAATRFQYGDIYGLPEFEKTKEISVAEDCQNFATEIVKKSNAEICCIPCKDLSFVKKPTVVGLGDTFAGGVLPELTLDKRGF